MSLVEAALLGMILGRLLIYPITKEKSYLPVVLAILRPIFDSDVIRRRTHNDTAGHIKHDISVRGPATFGAFDVIAREGQLLKADW